MNQVIKRDSTKQEYDFKKILKAVAKAYASFDKEIPKKVTEALIKLNIKVIESKKEVSVEEIQDKIENILAKYSLPVAKAYILYRYKHRELRLIKDRAEYIEKYSEENDNAATASEIDANANIQNKNVATLEAELYKTTNTELSRYRVTKKLQEMYNDEIADCYKEDLENHIIYKHDEGSAPAIKPYCVAVNLYPFMQYGTSVLDGLRTEAPKNMNSFVGQFNNLVFLLSSQFQGAVAFGEFFNVFYYYCVKEWGKDFWKNENDAANVTVDIKKFGPLKYKKYTTKKTISETIEQYFQAIVYTINQPAGNRAFQSPFTNISYYDSNYWHALFDEFVFPDGSKPEWEGVSYLQKKFIRWFNKERSKTLLTFPVETMALLSDKYDILDLEYKNLTCEMYAAGHSFFTYISDSPDSLASCCRLRNPLDKNEFSFTNGLTGVATGSKSVITLNLNRIIQNTVNNNGLKAIFNDDLKSYIVKDITDILSRVYKYHSAYNELLWGLYDNNMLPVYSKGFINLNQQFLTIGINGLNEAAEFLNLKCKNTEQYRLFCNAITSTISECNRKAEKNPYNPKHKIKLNTEQVPAESLGIKFYNWDKADGYLVPEDRNCYTSYFFKPDDESVNILEKLILHGRNFTSTLDGGVACHINLEEHLSYKQYEEVIKIAVKNGTSYFTFNVPNVQCDDCGYIAKNIFDKCPKCGSTNVTWWTRIIGYLRPVKSFSKGRRIEHNKRIYEKHTSINKVCRE